VTAACDDCLRRSHLLGDLAVSIQGVLSERTRVPVGDSGLLGLSDERLVAAVAPGRADELLEALAGFDPDSLRRLAERRELRPVCRHSGEYPAELLTLADHPAVLFCGGEGSLAALTSEPVVAVVGTRRPSPYGLEVATRLGRDLAVAGITVASGLALGIDAAAHRGCVDAGGRPLAVLAGGADVPYPRRHTPLYRRVRERGLVVSELPPGQPPRRWGFPARNRIMAGLAQMTVVVEAAEPSGSLITARFALYLGRAVGAVPGSVTARRAEGSNHLLSDGATVVRGVQDVLDELYGVGVRAAPRERAAERLAGVDHALLDAVEAGIDPPGLSAAAGLPAREVRAALSRLEVAGLVRRAGVGGYMRTARPR
jgi:DNA processing protein